MGSALTLYESNNFILLNSESHFDNKKSVPSGKKGFLKNENSWVVVGGKHLTHEECLHIDDLLCRNEHQYLEVFLEAV
ncbi:hypothetical protein ACTFQF_00760 [Aliivibrio fischeri]|uniref:Uncharacterized protein n=1 Tax=Aliivibrio fischeri (strain MJ11) TaxID=388396 RepID=B5EW94_ALIFM|nr:hypothetical protein [Aliivibrio fischeri]ACH64791.1 hypothetical protein VFMJ11_B0151 [Aliivibrio fischeri MJ11]MUK37583.1 hypothetical protein [Aliivibrio fischeri]